MVDPYFCVCYYVCLTDYLKLSSYHFILLLILEIRTVCMICLERSSPAFLCSCIQMGLRAETVVGQAREAQGVRERWTGFFSLSLSLPSHGPPWGPPGFPHGKLAPGSPVTEGFVRGCSSEQGGNCKPFRISSEESQAITSVILSWSKQSQKPTHFQMERT